MLVPATVVGGLWGAVTVRFGRVIVLVSTRYACEHYFATDGRVAIVPAARAADDTDDYTPRLHRPRNLDS